MAKTITKDNSPFEGKIETEVSSIISTGTRGPKNNNWKEVFITAIIQGTSVIDACREADVHPTLPYKTRCVDEEFKNAWKEAAEIGIEFLEQEAIRRAYHGVLKPVFHKGVECGYVREYSNTLLITLLKAHKPEKYRDNSDDTPKGATILNINVNVVDQPIQPRGESQVIEVQAIGEDSREDDKRIPETVTIPTE